MQTHDPDRESESFAGPFYATIDIDECRGDINFKLYDGDPYINSAFGGGGGSAAAL